MPLDFSSTPSPHLPILGPPWVLKIGGLIHNMFSNFNGNLFLAVSHANLGICFGPKGPPAWKSSSSCQSYLGMLMQCCLRHKTHFASVYLITPHNQHLLPNRHFYGGCSFSFPRWMRYSPCRSFSKPDFGIGSRLRAPRKSSRMALAWYTPPMPLTIWSSESSSHAPESVPP